MIRSAWLIARSVLLEAVRRKEIYTIVLLSTLLIGCVMSLRFFEIEGLTKFYREVALKVMSIATALTVIVLSARQLPREFENRTIYPLLAKPITRFTFLCGKLLGVMLAAIFCFALFMLVYLAGTYFIGGEIPWALFFQFIYLQILMMLILATLSFWLSMVMNLDAALTVAVLFYSLASVFTNATSFIYDTVSAIGQKVIVFLIIVIPQLTLFDLSEKTVHAQAWGPVPAKVILILTGYCLVYTVIYFACAAFCFRRRAL